MKAYTGAAMPCGKETDQTTVLSFVPHHYFRQDGYPNSAKDETAKQAYVRRADRTLRCHARVRFCARRVPRLDCIDSQANAPPGIKFVGGRIM